MIKLITSDLPVFLNNIDIGLYQTMLFIYFFIVFLSLAVAVVCNFFWEPLKFTSQYILKLFVPDVPFPYGHFNTNFALGP
jgi:hypothetical protein